MSGLKTTRHETINNQLAVGFSGAATGCFSGALAHLAVNMHRYDAPLAEAASYDNVAIPAGLGVLAIFSALNIRCRQNPNQD